VDVVYYGTRRELEYDFIVAPGASFKPIGLTFEGARRIRLDASGDLLIETAIGEIRQHKPLIYQQASGIKQAISGRYVMRGEREVGFEVGDYDPSRAMVIDPVFVYSTSIGGFYNDSASGVAVDAAGNAYITGVTTSLNFPLVNAFQPSLKIGVTVGIPSDAFVAKLNPSGTTLLYSTYLGGGSIDAANAIAVDSAGNAYVTGSTVSNDFPITPDAFQTKASVGGDAFVTKLNPTGDSLGYSTYLGGPGFFSSPMTASAGLGITADADGSAYVTGYTRSSDFPIRRAAQPTFNGGFGSNCCLCFSGLPPFIPAVDAFVTKLNSSGTGLIYSTFLGGTGQDEGRGIAVDQQGNAYVTGRTCSADFPRARNAYGGGLSDAFLTKLSPSGREFLWTLYIGGSGDDVGTGVAIASPGEVCVAGQTGSTNLQTTQGALQTVLGGSVTYSTQTSGTSWTGAIGLPNVSVNVLAIDPLNPSTLYAGLGACSKPSGVFKSTDAGQTWNASGLTNTIIQAIAVNPKNPSVLYADRYKSTDSGNTWTQMSLITSGGIRRLAIDPVTTTTIYLANGDLSCGDTNPTPPAFLKSTDSGNTWVPIRIAGSSFASSFAIAPTKPSTLYATSLNGDLYKSTDGGTNWSIPYDGHQGLVVLAIDPTDASTLYLRDTPSNINNLVKSTDGGGTFSNLGLTRVPIKDLAANPTNSSILYAATGDLGNGGGVFKSTDGGQRWNATDLIGMTINALAIDPLNSSRLYAGAYFDTDGFIAKINTQVSTLVYSTYLGTRSPDMATSIGVDDVGNAYVTGSTFSDRFPTRDALQASKASGPFDTNTFTTKLDATGSAILFSTYLVGNEPSFGSAIAVDAAGKTYVAGTTGLRAIVPSARLPESAHGGFDAFVIKIASPPRIADASVSGKNLIATGDGFDKGAVILVDGAEQRTRNDESKPTMVLIGKKAAKNIAPGQRVSIRVRNSDGLLSESFSFTRLP
jgi:photosystem II stability/assembly factor-like uncharacterized protein